jgi:hypothetical protein
MTLTSNFTIVVLAATFKHVDLIPGARKHLNPYNCAKSGSDATTENVSALGGKESQASSIVCHACWPRNEDQDGHPYRQEGS